MKPNTQWLAGVSLAGLLASSLITPLLRAAEAPAAWLLAKQNAAIHRFSTLFTAQDMRNRLASGPGLDQAVAWCKQTGVTQVYLETFRDGYQAERPVLVQARDRFTRDGFLVSGCVTPTQVGKPSTGWKPAISCYTDGPTQERVRQIFEFTAGLFDQIMIDDFWFTDCACAECEAARQAKRVQVGDHAYPVAGNSWTDYRCELMVRVSQERVIGPARAINPQARLIIKFPQWYDRFQERGYEVIRETADFDQIWVGTETRDYQDKQWGGTVQYEAYFIMRWLGGIGGAKCGGGWYDWLGTTEKTYLEQARQTILAGARESMLFCYGGLQHDTGPNNITALRAQLPELFATAQQVSRRQARGIAAYKPAGSPGGAEARIFDFAGMLGLPLLPCHKFPADAPAAFFSIHAWQDPALAEQLARFIQEGKPVLVTDGLAAKLAGKVSLDAANVQVLPVRGDPPSILQLPAEKLDRLRSTLLPPFKTTFQAPSRVALYLFTGGSWVIENFSDREVETTFNGRPVAIPARGWKYAWE